MSEISKLLNTCKYLIYDGAMGTMLMRHGMRRGDITELMNFSMPDKVELIHRQYIEAGSDIIVTNSFGANSLSLKKSGRSVREVVEAAMNIAKAAVNAKASSREAPAIIAKRPVLVAMDIGPTGYMLEPAGELEFDEAYDVFKEVALLGKELGADLFAIETMSDVEELRAAMTAVGDNTGLPVFATMTFNEAGRTFMGCTPEQFVEVAEECGAIAIGLNCSLEPKQMFNVAERIVKVSRLPLIIKPNAGLPNVTTGEYSVGIEEFTAQMSAYKELGVKVVGGCCGTTPEYIRALKEVFV